MKFTHIKVTVNVNVSQPARAVWIEIALIPIMIGSLRSQPARAVWIEIVPLFAQ